MPQKPSEQEWQSGHRLVGRVVEDHRKYIDEYFKKKKQGTFVPVEPRKAATVMLVRQEDAEHLSRYRSSKPVDKRMAPPNGIEVFMLRRQKTMKFVPNAVVFPGGRVDPKDADPSLPWAGPSPAEWAQRIGRDEITARVVLSAAVREVFEESGVLLAGPDEHSVVEDVSDPEWIEERRRLVEHEQCLSELLIRENLVIRTDLLNYISNWCTPEYSPMRYDTFFFAARCPDSQTPDDRSRESYIADWVEPQWAFDLGDDRVIDLMVPTAYNLGFVVRSKDLNDLMTTVHPAYRFMEEPEILEDGEYAVTGILP